MHLRRRIFSHCQVALTSATVLLIAGLVVGLWWVNRSGFAGQWGDKVSSELSQRGIHADFSSVRFSPFRGLIAREVIIYRDEERDEIIAEIPRLHVDIDRADAMRGDLTLRKLTLKEATINASLPSEEKSEHPLTIGGLSCQLRLDRQGRLMLEKGTATLGKISVDLQAELDHCDLTKLLARSTENKESGNTSFLDSLFTEFSRWQFPNQSPPHLLLKIQGSLKTPSAIRTSFSFTANQLHRNYYKMNDVLIAGELHRHQMTLDRVEFSDAIGTLTARAGYHIMQEKGRYEVESTIHLATMLRSCFDLHTLDDIKATGSPNISAHGEFQRNEDGTITVAMGRLEMPEFRFLGHPFQGLSTEFSWENGDIFLRDLVVEDEKGTFQGDILIKGDDIRYQAKSSLAVASYHPFIEKGSGLDQIISRASLTEHSQVVIDAKGWMQRSNLKNWSSEGHAHATKIAFNKVALKEAKTQFAINSKGSSFQDTVATFDYRDYELQRKHGGPTEAVVTAKRIAHDRKTNLTTIEELKGTAWPAPVLRLFARKTASYIERTYRTRQLPTFTANGIVDQNKDRARTEVRADIKIPGVTDYHFLGENLELSNASFHLKVRPREVDISKLSFATFNGTAGGQLTVFTAENTPPTFKGGLKWTRLHLANIGKTYGFEQAKQGLVTGRFDFSGSSESVRSLNGQGNLGLENGHLFYVPILGPLSAPLGEILGSKRSSYEEARNAFCTFAVLEGIFQTSDFLTSTPSSIFTGEGLIDLHRQTIDMTIRMNARGLLGLITLPLRPFNGLFQFRGTGHLDDPVWRNSSFTTPTRGKDDPIFRKPGKAQIVRD